jgi:transcriptional regulator with XRE-family HTH domain
MEEKSFQDVFKELRIEKNLSQEAIAKELDVSPALISKWENNLSTPGPEMLEYIADYFDVSTDYLIGRTNDRRYFKQNDDSIEDFNLLFNKYKGLSDSDKEFMKNMIIERRKQMDKQLGEDNDG